MNKFAKLDEQKNIVYAKIPVNIDGVKHYAPSDETYLAAGFKPVIDERPYTSPTEYAVAVGWEELENSISRIYEIRPIKRTEADFNAALENHLLAERTARGYDTREPSDYFGSSVGRWRQDALDWIAHRDRVMEYGFAVLNEWKRTGIEPSYDEFVANLPKITWTEA